jgi:pyrroline-5-carboxylate reductase
MHFAIIGCGNMGRALLRGILKAGLAKASNIVVTSRSAARREALEREFGVSATADNRSASQSAEVLILAVKPQNLATVATQIRGSLRTNALVISVLAGKTTNDIARLLSPKHKHLAVIRVMPNIPVMVDAGCSPYARGAAATDAQAALAARILGSVGDTLEVAEDHMDTVTGLSGSGPAYVYMMIEALADGGVKMGLPRDVATRLAAQTVHGAALVVKETGLHPAVLRDQVTTPGGTAIAATSDLEGRGLRPMLISAVVTATERSRQLSGA